MNRFAYAPAFRFAHALPGWSLDTAAPAFDIVHTGDDRFRITLVAPGVRTEDLTVETHEGVLTVAATPAEQGDEDTRYVHHGIGTFGFRRTFRLAEHVEVTGARLDNGLLHIELERQLPEALKPRTIQVQVDGATAMQHGEPEAAGSIEHDQAA